MERRFLAEDPGLAGTFEVRQGPQQWPVERSTLVIGAVALTLGGLMLLVGSLAGAAAFAGVTVLIGLVWRWTDGTRA